MPTRTSNRTRAAVLASGGAALLLSVYQLADFGEDYDRWEFVFAAQGVTEEGWDDPDAEARIQGITLEVRPPHLSWWVWTSFAECRVVGIVPDERLAEVPDDHGLFACRYTTPARWGCHEIRIRRRAVIREWNAMIEPPQMISVSVSSEPSNSTYTGTCPDPMPERIPLATPEAVAAPEPDAPWLICLGVLALAGIASAATRKDPPR